MAKTSFKASTGNNEDIISMTNVGNGTIYIATASHVWQMIYLGESRYKIVEVEFEIGE